MGKNILMICYYYPPLTDVGCKRSVAFSKYWKRAGWRPHVLSVKNPDRTYCSLGKDIPPEGIDVTYTYSLFNIYKFFGIANGLLSRFFGLFGVRLKNYYFYDLFCIPDWFIGWVIPAVISGLKIIKRKKIDIIYVSCSPFSAGLIGLLLKKITGKPLVIDYRDPFGLDYGKYQKVSEKKRFREPIDRRIAEIIIEASDLFTVTTKETEQLYIEQFPSVKNKISTIYNGFDHKLLDGLQEQEKFSKFTIIYTGNFYFDIEFDYFFEGLGILKREGEINVDNFQFLFYGGNFDPIKESIEKHDVLDLVVIKSRIPYVEVLKEIKRSHLQLLRIMQPMISTKLFEGISLNVPFLATIPSGEVEEIVNKYNPDSYVITDNSANSIALNIKKAMGTKKEFINSKVDFFIERFSREKISMTMLELFNNL